MVRAQFSDVYNCSCLQMDALSFKKMDFPEFCAAAISVHQLEGTDRWEQHARSAYDIFEKEGNRVISVEELARVSISCLSISFSAILTCQVILTLFRYTISLSFFKRENYMWSVEESDLRCAMANFLLSVPVDATCSCHLSCVGDDLFAHLWNKWLRQKYQLLF